MIRDLMYFAVGLGKRVDRVIDSIIEEGKKELDEKSLVDIGKEHLQKRKENLRKVFGDDIKKMADEIGLATKDDIEQLKELLKKAG